MVQEAFQFVISSTEMSNAFTLNQILLDSYQKGIQEEHDKVAYWKETPEESILGYITFYRGTSDIGTFICEDGQGRGGE